MITRRLIVSGSSCAPISATDPQSCTTSEWSSTAIRCRKRLVNLARPYIE